MQQYENEYEERFHFIHDEILRKNLADALRHVAQLAAIVDRYPDELQPPFCKSIILHAASMIEAGLHYCLKSIIKDQIFESDWSYINMKVIHRIEEDSLEGISAREFGAVERFYKKLHLDRHLRFIDIEKLSLEKGLLSDQLHKKVANIRKLRNKIHLASLGEVDRGYSQKAINEVFDVAREIFQVVESKVIPL